MSKSDPKPLSPRDILSQRAPDVRGPVALWLDDPAHGEAAAFVREWLRMRDEGDTDWSARKLVSYLRTHFSFPFKHRDAVIAWAREQE